MHIVSYVSREFANMTALFDYLRDNVPWWYSTEDDKLIADNIQLATSGSSNTMLTITELNGGQSKSSTAMSNNSVAVVLITDDAVAVNFRVSGGTFSFIVGRATDGANEHYGALIKSSTAEIMCLCYGDVTNTIRSLAVMASTTNMQLIPAYAWNSAYHIENAYIVNITPNTTYNGKFELNGEHYVQCGGIALKYTE